MSRSLSGPAAAWVAAAALAGASAWSVARARLPHGQWDLKVYMACAAELREGRDPYAGELFVSGARTPCLYPPLILQAYRPFLALSEAAGPLCAHAAWTLAAAAASGLLLALWFGIFSLDAGPGTAVLLAWGFGSPILAALKSGNAAAFEAAALWAALAAFVRGREGAFAGGAAVAAQAKLLPVGFLGLLAAGRRPRWGLLAGGMALAAGLFALNGAAFPDLLGSYLRRLSDPAAAWRFERGPNNCALLGFLQHALEIAGGRRGPAAEAARALFAPLAAAVAAATWACARRLSRSPAAEESRRADLVLLACSAYALLSPRMKDYSYALMIPPAARALGTLPAGPAAALAALCLVDSFKAVAERAGLGAWAPLAGYNKLFASAFVWAVLARRCWKSSSANG